MTDLAFPDPRTTTLAEVRTRLLRLPEVRAYLRETGDIAGADVLRRQLEAVAKYVGHRETKGDVNAETRRVEVLIGELLGETYPGTRSNSLASENDLAKDDAYRFRLMARYGGLVEQLLTAEHRVVTRAAILAEISDLERRANRPPIRTSVKNPHMDLRAGDFREALADLTDIDAIITDPPYPREYLPLYADLAAFAEKSGVQVLAVMTGQYHLPEVMRLLDGRLPYRWTLALLTKKAATRQHAANVNTMWKPILLYGDRSIGIQTDIINQGDTSGPAHHKWGQGVDDLAALVERVTRPGWHVIDPFLGGGSTAIACQRTGRDFTGCDIDPACVETTRSRLT